MKKIIILVSILILIFTCMADSVTFENLEKSFAFRPGYSVAYIVHRHWGDAEYLGDLCVSAKVVIVYGFPFFEIVRRNGRGAVIIPLSIAETDFQVTKAGKNVLHTYHFTY